MLEILLLILKLLGIILLVILGLLVIIIILVLFAPIKYKANGRKDSESLDALAWITYLNPIVRVKIHYPDEVLLQVKILGFTMKRSASKNSSKTISEEESSHEIPKEEAPKEENTEKEAEEIRRENVESKDNQNKQVDKVEPEQDDTKNSALDTIGYYTSLYKENKELILKLIKIILKACKTLLPRKCRIKAVFGTGKADLTGQIYGLYCSIKDYLPGEVFLEPVWTEKYLEGEFIIKGKIRLIHVLIAVILIFKDKESRLLIKKLRRV